ncbi:unnamed protein product [Brachionus calyciflorus]|uniref:Uncharacterized protein n=1 Tax=Brachionus calyciflorus TaxID=104777 RepID=A0A813VPF6_9BILA|nr:unnamed protein product [Brachionus calyciflorus]
MDCAGLQALGSDSESLESDISLQDIEQGSNNELASKLAEKKDLESKENYLSNRKKEAENLYETYKNGLKYLANKEYLSAKDLFEQILKSPLIVEKSLECDEIEKDLTKLKYILFKNLSLIQSKYLENYKSALEFLIQAAKIDGTDLNLWYEIGCISLKIGKLIISKLAFEECLDLNQEHWPSLDNLIILLFAVGNYSECLKNIFVALKMDKYYLNGLICLKKIQLSNFSLFTNEIDNFIQTEYKECALEVDDILDQADEENYDELINRISFIKNLHHENVKIIKETQKIDDELVVSIKANMNR